MSPEAVQYERDYIVMAYTVAIIADVVTAPGDEPGGGGAVRAQLWQRRPCRRAAQEVQARILVIATPLLMIALFFIAGMLEYPRRAGLCHN